MTDLSGAKKPNFTKICEAFGGAGYEVKTKDEFRDALKSAINANKVAFIDVQIDRFEEVLPMVPAGGALYNMILE